MKLPSAKWARSLLGVTECANVLNVSASVVQFYITFIKKNAVRKDFTSFFKKTWKPHQFWTVTFLFYPKVIYFLCISRAVISFCASSKVWILFPAQQRLSKNKYINYLYLCKLSMQSAWLTVQKPEKKILFVLYLDLGLCYSCLFVFSEQCLCWKVWK